MIVGYAVNPDPHHIARAYIIRHELLSGKPVIYLGGPLEKMNNILKNEPHRIMDERVRCVDNWESHFEMQCERMITHEWIHIIIYGLTDSEQTCRDFDNVDGMRKTISSCGLEFAFGGKQ